MSRFIITSLFLLVFSAMTFAENDNQAVTEGDSAGSPPNIGNFALPSPQQPGPLLSFGQTLIGRNHLQVSLETFSPYRIGGAFDSLSASLTYGITDSTSLYFNYPLKADPDTRVLRSGGLFDITLQLEQAIYTAGNTHYQDQATIVGAMTIPLEDAVTAHLKGGYGAPTYFLGATYNRTYVDWMGFVSPGVLITTSSDRVRLGSQALYQAGIGRNIITVKDQSILFALLEFNGQYTEKDEALGVVRPNTGGNLIALTPSLLLSTKSVMAQVGVGFPVVQNLNGNQKKTDYFIAANFTWTIA